MKVFGKCKARIKFSVQTFLSQSAKKHKGFWLLKKFVQQRGYSHHLSQKTCLTVPKIVILAFQNAKVDIAEKFQQTLHPLLSSAESFQMTYMRGSHERILDRNFQIFFENGRFLVLC